MIEEFCGTEITHTNQDYFATVQGGISLKHLPGVEAQGNIHYSNSEARGLIGALENQLDNNQLHLSEMQIDCMRPFIGRILDAILAQLNQPNSPSSTAQKEKVVGWLHYTLGQCNYQDGGTVSCSGSLLNADDSDHGLMALVAQTGGIRSIYLDRYGIATAIDDMGNSYQANTITIGNQTSGETGQFLVTLISGLKTPYTINFPNVNAQAESFFRITIPVLVKGNSFELKADKIPLQK